MRPCWHSILAAYLWVAWLEVTAPKWSGLEVAIVILSNSILQCFVAWQRHHLACFFWHTSLTRTFSSLRVTLHDLSLLPFVLWLAWHMIGYVVSIRMINFLLHYLLGLTARKTSWCWNIVCSRLLLSMQSASPPSHSLFTSGGLLTRVIGAAWWPTISSWKVLGFC